MPTSPSRRGASLLECLAAIVIIGTATVSGIQIYEVSARVHTVGADSSSTYVLLRREVERVKSLDFDVLASTDWFPLRDALDYEVQVIVDSAGSDAHDVSVRLRKVADPIVTSEVQWRRYRVVSRDGAAPAPSVDSGDSGAASLFSGDSGSTLLDALESGLFSGEGGD